MTIPAEAGDKELVVVGSLSRMGGQQNKRVRPCVPKPQKRAEGKELRQNEVKAFSDPGQVPHSARCRRGQADEGRREASHDQGDCGHIEVRPRATRPQTIANQHDPCNPALTDGRRSGQERGEDTRPHAHDSADVQL